MTPREGIILMSCCFLAASNAIWQGEEGCGESRYPDAGQDEELKISGRIIGGEDSRPYEFPYQALLTYKNITDVFCGGVLIADQWVLTAAHCVIAFSARDMKKTVRIRLGAHNLAVRSPKPVTRKASVVIIHEDYVPATFDNDIALIKLNKAAIKRRKRGKPNTRRIIPVCPPRPTDDAVGKVATVSGWGTLDASVVRLPDVLQYIPMELISNPLCSEKYENRYPVTASMLCGLDGDLGDQRDACQGDSGGPMTMKGEDGVFRLIGLVSWGLGCAGGFPGVYTRINYLLDWINENLD